MFGSTVLEVGIGLVFVYWLLGLLCSIINEQVIVPLLKLRATFLEEGIKNMLTDPQGDKLVQALYDSPLIKGLSRKYNKPLIQRLLRKEPSGAPKPSYIPGDIFASVLMSLDVVQAYKDNPSVANNSIPDALKSLIDKAKNDPAANTDPTKVLSIAEANIEKWFNDSMDRVTGWYKRRVQLIIFFLGFVIVVALNVDTISIITRLSNDSVMRAAFVSAAQGSTNTASNANLATLQKSLEQIQLVGWSTFPPDFWSWISKIVGLLASTFAVALGAPFWFDLLNKFMAFRSSGPPPQPRTGPSESTGTPSRLAITVVGASPDASTNGLSSASGSTGTPNSNL